MTAQHSPFKAIADSTRREILSLLFKAKDPLPITTITECFNTTRQAVTKHIKILHAAGLIEIRKSGRERYCSLRTAPLMEIHRWLIPYLAETEEKPAAPESAQVHSMPAQPQELSQTGESLNPAELYKHCFAL